MPRLPVPPVGDRFFARLLAARLECPACGYLDHFASKGPSRGRQSRDRKTITVPGWNPLTSRWQCRSCRRTFVLGVLAWPVSQGGPAKATLPRDAVPGTRQLLQLRSQGGGLWLRDSLKAFRATGANIAAGCTCKPGCHYTNQSDPDCPLRDPDEEG